MEKRKSGETEVFKDDNCDDSLDYYLILLYLLRATSIFFLVERQARLHEVGVFFLKNCVPSGRNCDKKRH